MSLASEERELKQFNDIAQNCSNINETDSDRFIQGKPDQNVAEVDKVESSVQTKVIAMMLKGISDNNAKLKLRENLSNELNLV